VSMMPKVPSTRMESPPEPKRGTVARHRYRRPIVQEIRRNGKPVVSQRRAA